ncbi:MAG TPA: tetratricopeptide repeat protein [Chryseolinea sp.]
MKTALFLFAAIVLSLPLAAQIESLENRLVNADRDTARVNTLNKLAILYFNSVPAKSRLYTTKALSLADSLHYTPGLAEAYLAEAAIYRLKGQSTKDLESLIKAMHLFESLNDSLGIARTYTEMGISDHQQGDYNSARVHYEKALALHKAIGNRLGVATTLRRIGIMEAERKEYQRAFNTFSLALEIEREINNVEGIANLLNNIGVNFYEMGEYNKALEYYEQSMPLFKSTNNLNRLPAAYHNFARVYLAQGNIDEAQKYAELGLPIARETGNMNAMMLSMQLFADIFLARKDYEDAYEYLKKAKDIEDSIVNKSNSVQYAQLMSLIATESKEQEIELMKKEQEWALFRQKFTYASLGFALFVGGIVIYYQRRNIRDKKNLLEKNKQISEAQQALLKVDLENKRLAERQLQYDLEFRHKELLTYTLNLVQKNTVMQNVREGINELLPSTDKDSKVKFTKLLKVIDYSLESEKDWDEFRMYFEKVHSSFFEKIKLQHPDLTQGDLKLCALISLNLSMKEMAELMGISPESVKMARHRLRKKLNLHTEENLAEFVAAFKSA